MRQIGFTIMGGCLFGLVASLAPAGAQPARESPQERESEAAIKARKNAWTVGLVGGLFEGTFMRFASEIGKTLDNDDEIRVLPIVSRGAAANLEDLLYLQGVDVAVTQSDVFEFFRTQRGIPDLERRVHYILSFPLAEFHLITRSDVRDIEELRGRKVHFGSAGAAGSLTGPIVFARLGIAVETVTDFDNLTAMEKLRSGEVDALVRVVSKPVSYVSQIKPDSGLRLLPVPYTKKLEDFYTLGEFTSDDYPTVVPKGARIDTIAVPGVLAVYNWPKNSDRYRRVERFVEKLFENWDEFQKPAFHPKWRDINLAAVVPGWTRFSVAQELLQSLKTRGNKAEDEVLIFRDFLKWRDREQAERRR